MEIKKSKNTVQVAGVLIEKNLEFGHGDREITDFSHGNKKQTVECDFVKKKEFMNPALTIECEVKGADGKTQTVIVGVDFKSIGFGITSVAFDKDGKLDSNSNFTGIKTVNDNYITKAEAIELSKKTGETVLPTRVYIQNGTIVPNEYVDKTFVYKVNTPTIETYNVTSSFVPEEDICAGFITGVIRTITDEIVNENETGRLNVEMYAFNAKETFPIKFTVRADLADDFKQEFSQGDNAYIDYKFANNHIGAVKKAHAGFSKEETNIVFGKDILELSIVNGYALEEEDESFVDNKNMKEAMTARQNIIDTAIEKKKSSPVTSTGKSGGLGRGASKNKVKNEEGFHAPEAEEELPF